MAGAIPAMKVAIIGSGPSAFYAAARLLAAGAGRVEGATGSGGSGSGTRSADGSVSHVHMYERLPTPHGLVRFGVAPDHPEVKNVEHKFAQVATDPRFRFFGNVNVVGGGHSGGHGQPHERVQAMEIDGTRHGPGYTYPHALRLHLAELAPHYTHLLLAYGCSQSRQLGIAGSAPGELANVHAALDFVNWYNGHPAAHDPQFLQEHPWRRVRFAGTSDGNSARDLQHATVIGAGNVALDVARILLHSSSTLHPLFQADSSIKARAALRETDIPEPVLAELARCRIEHVDIVARRGPAQVAFTSKELREMMDLQGVAFRQPRQEHYALAHEQMRGMEMRAKDAVAAESAQQLSSEMRVRKRLLSIMEKGSSADPKAAVSWGLDFFKSPAALHGGDDESNCSIARAVSAVRWDEMEFERVPSVHDRDQPWSGGLSPAIARVRSTGKQTTSATDMVISSVGYSAEPLGTPSQAGKDAQRLGTIDAIPWDTKRGTTRNRGGQVIDDKGIAIPGLYTSGWVARGPVGVIASTRIDANSVVEQMLHDWQGSKGTACLPGVHDGTPQEGAPSAVEKPSAARIVSWNDWLRLDERELELGKALGKLREKFVSVKDMLEYLN